MPSREAPRRELTPVSITERRPSVAAELQPLLDGELVRQLVQVLEVVAGELLQGNASLVALCAPVWESAAAALIRSRLGSPSHQGQVRAVLPRGRRRLFPWPLAQRMAAPAARCRMRSSRGVPWTWAGSRRPLLVLRRSRPGSVTWALRLRGRRRRGECLQRRSSWWRLLGGARNRPCCGQWRTCCDPAAIS